MLAARPRCNVLPHRASIVWRDLTANNNQLRFKYAARWKLRHVATPFLAWFELMIEEREKRSRLQGIVTRMKRRTEVLVVQEWRRYVVEAHAALARGMGRWANGALSSGWTRWHEVWAAGVRAKGLLRKAVARAFHQMLAKVYLAWSGHVKETVREREVARVKVR